MIRGQYWELQDDDAVRKLDAAAVSLLERCGCRIEHDGLLDILGGAGCRIDRPARRCYFPEKLIREAVGCLGGRADANVELPPRWNPQHGLTHGGSYPHLVEWPECRRRLATRQDVIDMAKMAHVLDEFRCLGKVLVCTEVDQRIEPLWAAVTLAQITDKPVRGGEVLHAHCIEPLVRMGEVLSGKAGDTSLVPGCDFFIAPLVFDGEQAECFLVKRRFGMGNVPGTMPIAGISSPVTIAGTVTVALAELMAGWTMGYAVDPGLPAGGIVSTGSLDMRTLTAQFGGPEALLQDATVVNVCRRLYGIPVHAATGYVDCKRPGLEAAFQKMLPLAAAPFGTGFRAAGGGLLSAGQDYSPIQHLLDAEMGKGVERFFATYQVSDETIALDVIEDMLRRPGANFLEMEHTARHYRAEQWYPGWFDRTAWQGDAVEAEAERKMLERIDSYWKAAVGRYERPAIDGGKVAELRRIFAGAERQICGSNFTPV